MTSAWRLLAAGLLAAAAGAQAQVMPLVEFYNKSLDHYFTPGPVMPAAAR